MKMILDEQRLDLVTELINGNAHEVETDSRERTCYFCMQAIPSGEAMALMDAKNREYSVHAECLESIKRYVC